MDNFLTEKTEEKRGLNKGLLLGLVAGALIVAAIIGIFALRPSTKQIAENTMEGAIKEDNPQFAALTKKIVAETDANRTTQSPTGMGTIVMNIGGKILNLTGKTLTGLEIKVTVIDSFGNPVRDKTLVVIPREEVTRLEHNQTLPVQVLVEGFSKEDDRAQIRWKVTAIKVD